MRLLVFCGSRRAIERFDMDPDWQIIVSIYPMEQRAKTIEWLHATPNAKLAVDRSMLHGWRAPDDTVVLFDPSWPYPHSSAESIQAISRVRAPLQLPPINTDEQLTEAVGPAPILPPDEDEDGDDDLQNAQEGLTGGNA